MTSLLEGEEGRGGLVRLEEVGVFSYLWVKPFERNAVVLYQNNSLHLTWFLSSPENQKLNV